MEMYQYWSINCEKPAILTQDVINNTGNGMWHIGELCAVFVIFSENLKIV